VPREFRLYQNYPNPFNHKSNIKYQIAKNSEVKLVIYDIRGCEVSTLVNEQLQPGTYEVEFDGVNYTSGIYFYKLIITEYTKTKKLILLK